MLERRKGRVFLFFAMTLAGTSVIAARLASGISGPFTIAAVSFLFAVLFLLPLSLKKLAGEMRNMTGEKLLMILLQALFGMLLFRLLLIKGLEYTSAFEAGILTGATPAITAVLAITFLKEKNTLKKSAGIVCTVAGVLLIQGLIEAGDHFSAAHLSGNLLVLGAAACESIFSILSRVSAVRKHGGTREEIDPLVQTTLVACAAFLLCLIPALFESPVKELADAGLREWLALLWYGLLGTALAYMCWFAGIKRSTALTAAAFSGMMPFTSMFLSAVFLGEQAGWQQWAGGLLVAAGMFIIGTAGGKNKQLLIRKGGKAEK